MMDRVAAFVDRNFFFVAFAVLAPLAAAFPGVACSGGTIVPEVTIFWVDVMLIFFVEGLTLPTAAIKDAAGRCRAHATTQLYNLALIPAATRAATTGLLAAGWMTPPLRDAFLALACIPSTTSMCVMLAAKSGGNAPLAAFNAVLSNALAVVWTPALLSRWTRTDPALRPPDLALGLVAKMILPQLLGQLLRARVGARKVATNMAAIGRVNQTFILLLLWQVLSDVFAQSAAVGRDALLATLALVPILHYTFFAGAWSVGGCLHLPPGDRVAVLFAGTTKTVVLGVPLLRSVYGDRPPGEFAVLMLPLVTYHLLELVNGLSLAPRLFAWVAAEARRRGDDDDARAPLLGRGDGNGSGDDEGGKGTAYGAAAGGE